MLNRMKEAFNSALQSAMESTLSDIEHEIKAHLVTSVTLEQEDFPRSGCLTKLQVPELEKLGFVVELQETPDGLFVYDVSGWYND